MTTRRTLFVGYYLGKAAGNATLAARMAGFRQPRVAGPRLLRVDEVADAVDQKLALVGMDADETLAIVSALARANIGDSLRFDADPDADDMPSLDLRKARRRDRLGCIKKLEKTTRSISADDDGPPETETTVEVELYDPIRALGLMMKSHRLDGSTPPLDPQTAPDDYEELLSKLYPGDPRDG